MKKLLTFLTLLTLFFGVGWAADITDVLTRATTGVTGTSYTAWSGKTVTSNAVYAGQSAGDKESIQLRSSNSNSGVVTTGSGGKVKSITVVWNDATADGRTLNVYGKSTAYSQATELYNSSNQGTLLGTIVKGTSTTLTISGDYEYIGFRSASGAMYLTSVTIVWEGAVSSVGAPSISFDSFTAGKTTSTVTITPGENATSTSYKVGDGTYQPYTEPIEIDLTSETSPITVYAKSSDGTNESTEVSATFTVPALGLSIAPASYTGYEAQTVTLTPSNYVGDYLISYTINNGTAQDYTAPFTISDPGTYEIVATVLDDRADAIEVTKTSTITINEAVGVNLPFVETFNGTDGTGGNNSDSSGNQWNGSIATSTIVYDNEGWSVFDNWGGQQCIRLGTGSKKGTITSPTIKGLTIGETYTLTFKAAPWGTASTIMNVTASGATVSGLPTEAMTTGQWNDFTVTLTATATTTTITFTADQNRFWLDEINVTEQSTTVADGYYLFGQFNGWATGDSNYKFTQQSDGSYVLTVSNYTANNQFKFAKYENGTATLIGVSNGGNNYGLHSTHHTGIAMNTGDDTYSINDSGEMIFTIHADETAYDVDKQVYMKGTYNSWANEAMTLTADGWTITKQLDANTELGFQDTWGSGIWHGCGDNSNNITVDQDKLDTDLALWTDGKNFVIPTAGSYTFTVSLDLSKVVISKVPESHAITTSVVTDPSDKIGGTISADKETAMAGETVTLTINANNGYELTSVTVNGTAITATDGVYSFEMPDAVAEVIAYFAAKTLNITVNNDNNKGTVSGIPATSTVGSAISFTVTPNTGYNVSSVSYTFTPANGTPNTQTLTAPYSFNMPGYDVTVNVYYTEAFSEKKYQLITSIDEIDTDKTYLIVGSNSSGDSYQVMGANGDNRMIAVSTTPDEDGIITSIESMNIITLETSGSNYAIHAEEGYLNNTGSSNGLSISETAVYAGITFDSETGKVSIQLVDNSSKGLLSYNTSGLFRFYGSSQAPTYLYKEIDDNSVKAPTISPEGGTFLNSQYPNGITVTVTPVTEGSTIHVSTDGENYTPYTAATTLTVTETTTVTAYATKEDLTSETVSETYNLVDVILEDVQFSPIPGTYSGAQTLQMYTTNQNAKIYYTTNGSTPSATNGTLYSGEIDLAVGNTYNFKAIAVLGNNTSDVAEGTYTINAASTSGLNSIAQLNAASTGTTKRTMNNPVQVIYMNTWRHKDGTVQGTNTVSTVIPEYAYIRDNTGYSLVYFGNGWYNTWADAVDDPKICEMGDWIPAGVLKGAVQVWSDGFHNELGGRNNASTITGWPTATDELKNTPIIPEEMTNTNINAGWSAPASFATTFNAAVAEYVANNNLSEDPNEWTSSEESAVHAYAAAAATDNEGYIKYVEDGNVWGHYVHLRKNTIRVTNITNADDAIDGVDANDKTATRKKYSGFITDQSGDELTYYDAFYNFSGFNGTPNYSDDFFQNIQNNGGTFDVYGIVGFYGPKAADVNSNYSPFEVFPIDFLYIYKPTFNITSGTYYDTQEVTLSCATEGATIWYKTSDMEDYAEYTGPITVDATTTIEAYSSIPTKYNDIMESIVNTIDVNIGNLDAPVISPESQVKTVGETVDATITCATEDATIYFTVDGSDPRDENSARYEYTSENIAEYLTGISQTTTVRAIAYITGTTEAARGYYSREAEAKTYTFVKTNGIVYTLVTDQTQLNESSVYVIVNKANHMAMSVAQNDNNRGAAGVKFVDEATKMQVEGNGDVALFMLTKVGNKWYIKTNNSDVNGYLAVGDGNLLLTNAAADDNAEATITIDADAEHQAHISFAYNNALTRYLRYWLGGQAFSTYTSETSNLPVSLYYLAATPLANIEKEGTIEDGKNQYTIADQLIGVYADIDNGVLWCKDQGDASIDKTYIKDGQIDFMRQAGVQAGDWDQSNWVALQFTTPNGSNNIDLLVSSAVGKYIKQATVQGYYVDDVNFTIRMAEDKLELVEPDEVEYTKNVYCTTNFLPANLNIWGNEEDGGYTTGNTQNYFFMNPKIQEVCHITWAQWDATNGCFTVPTTSGFDGAFQVGWKYNQGGNVSSSLQDEVQYEFDAIVQRASKTAYGPKDKVTTPNYGITVLPLNLSASSTIVTAINTVDVNGKAVKSVKYVNVAGIMSDTPFEGVNIVVTEYTDGSRSTTKMLRK